MAGSMMNFSKGCFQVSIIIEKEPPISRLTVQLPPALCPGAVGA